MNVKKGVDLSNTSAKDVFMEREKRLSVKQTKKKKETTRKKMLWRRSLLVLFLIPIAIFELYGFYYLLGNEKNEQAVLADATNVSDNELAGQSDIPPEYIPIYKAAEEKYGVPWYLLAAHHRIETRFSTMDPMVSPAGAIGHMQVRP